MDRIWDFLVRFRTWLIGAAGLVAVLLPPLAELANSPEIAAVLPDNWRPWVSAIGFICLVWSRWRPATRAADPEVQVKKAIEQTSEPSTIIVEERGETKAVIRG